MDPKECELKEYTFRDGMNLMCVVSECLNNNNGVCNQFKSRN